MHLKKHFMDQQHYLNNTQRGFIVLISTLVVGAVGVAITASIILLGLSSSRASFSLSEHTRAYWVANGCVEDALEQIRENTSYVGTLTENIGEGSCTYTVTDDGGEARTIKSEGVVRDFYSRLVVSVSSINPEIIIASWQEVATF